jgi:hypothetical protein
MFVSLALPQSHKSKYVFNMCYYHDYDYYYYDDYHNNYHDYYYHHDFYYYHDYYSEEEEKKNLKTCCFYSDLLEFVNRVLGNPVLIPWKCNIWVFIYLFFIFVM